MVDRIIGYWPLIVLILIAAALAYYFWPRIISHLPSRSGMGGTSGSKSMTDEEIKILLGQADSPHSARTLIRAAGAGYKPAMLNMVAIADVRKAIGRPTSTKPVLEDVVEVTKPVAELEAKVNDLLKVLKAYIGTWGSHALDTIDQAHTHFVQRRIDSIARLVQVKRDYPEMIAELNLSLAERDVDVMDRLITKLGNESFDKRELSTQIRELEADKTRLTARNTFLEGMVERQKQTLDTVQPALVASIDGSLHVHNKTVEAMAAINFTGEQATVASNARNTGKVEVFEQFARNSVKQSGERKGSQGGDRGDNRNRDRNEKRRDRDDDDRDENRGRNDRDRDNNRGRDQDEGSDADQTERGEKATA